MKLMPAGVDNLVLISDGARKKAYDVARGGAGGVNSKEGEPTSERKKWRIGEMEFEALMRSLDNAVSLVNQLTFFECKMDQSISCVSSGLSIRLHVQEPAGANGTAEEQVRCRSPAVFDFLYSCFRGGRLVQIQVS